MILWKRLPLRPRTGETRTVTRFAFLPVRTYDGWYIVWLERYLEKEKYTEGLGWATVWVSAMPRHKIP